MLLLGPVPEAPSIEATRIMRMVRLSALVIVFLGGGCLPPAQPAESGASESPIPEESKETARQGDEAMLAAQKQMDEQIEKNQTEIKTAMESALGKGAPGPGGQAPLAAAAAIQEIRKAGITLKLAPVLDAKRQTGCRSVRSP